MKELPYFNNVMRANTWNVSWLRKAKNTCLVARVFYYAFLQSINWIKLPKHGYVKIISYFLIPKSKDGFLAELHGVIFRAMALRNKLLKGVLHGEKLHEKLHILKLRSNIF